MIRFKQTGNFNKTTDFLNRAKSLAINKVLSKYGKLGVEALSSATPKDSELTANSWYYQITQSNGSCTITFNNSNIQDRVSIAIILQYGHWTGTGGWVKGIDYINPAIQPVFKKLADDAWKEVTKI